MRQQDALAVALALGLLLFTRRKDPVPPPPTRERKVLDIDGIEVFQHGTVLDWIGDLSIDADGSPFAYHPDDQGTLQGQPKGLDAPENAGSGGKWWGVATGGDGKPLVQGARDPAPGYWVSTTALVYPEEDRGTPARYVDSVRIPYLAVPPELQRLGVQLGDLAWVSIRTTGQGAAAQVADVGPRRKLGEGSIALARALALPLSPRLRRSAAAQRLGLDRYEGHGTRSGGIAIQIYSGTSPGRPLDPDEIARRVAALRKA